MTGRPPSYDTATHSGDEEAQQLVSSTADEKHHRKAFSAVFFAALVASELVMSLRVLLIYLISLHEMYVTYVFTGVVCACFWVYVSYELVGKRAAHYYILVDNLFLLSILCFICYVFLHSHAAKSHPWGYISMLEYFLVLFVLCGNFRVLMKHYAWTPTRLVIYKLNRAVPVILYITVGCATFDFYGTAVRSLNRDLYVMFLVTALVLLLEMYFSLSRLDRTEEMKLDYRVSPSWGCHPDDKHHAGDEAAR